MAIYEREICETEPNSRKLKNFHYIVSAHNNTNGGFNGASIPNNF